MNGTAADLLMARKLSIRYMALKDLHLNAAEAHARGHDGPVDTRICNALCEMADDPAEPHIDAGLLLGVVAQSEVHS